MGCEGRAEVSVGPRPPQGVDAEGVEHRGLWGCLGREGGPSARGGPLAPLSVGTSPMRPCHRYTQGHCQSRKSPGRPRPRPREGIRLPRAGGLPPAAGPAPDRPRPRPAPQGCPPPSATSPQSHGAHGPSKSPGVPCSLPPSPPVPRSPYSARPPSPPWSPGWHVARNGARAAAPGHLHRRHHRHAERAGQ